MSAIVSGSFVASIGLRLSPPNCQTEADEKAEDHKACDSILDRFWNWTTHDAVSFYTSVLALFTAVLGGSTIGLWAATNRSAGISERALLDLERSFIIPSFVPVQRDAEEWKVQIILSNVGRSYGIVKGLFVQFAEPNKLLPVPPEGGYEARPTDTVLNRDVEWPGLAPFTMPNKQEGQIIFGYILYEDAFGRLWRNHFACEVWSEEKPDRHFYPTIGGLAYNSETLQDRGRT